MRYNYNQKSSSSTSVLTFDRKWDRCNDSVSIPILNQFKKLVDAKTLWIIRSREISRAVSSSKSSLEVQMNWLSTQVQSSPPSPSWTRGKKGTLNLSWKSVQLNFFWTFWTLYSSEKVASPLDFFYLLQYKIRGYRNVVTHALTLNNCATKIQSTNEYMPFIQLFFRWVVAVL